MERKMPTPDSHIDVASPCPDLRCRLIKKIDAFLLGSLSLPKSCYVRPSCILPSLPGSTEVITERILA